MKNQTIVLTGGGTGGHITPILAVAHELKRQNPNLRLVYIGERRGKFAELLQGNQDIDATYTIFAGKFRRYHGESWLKRLFAIKTNLLNLRDAFYVIFGIVQSYRLLGKIKPNALFQKGGFVGMPVGLAAAARHIPFVTHDSDMHPGLANRVVSRWARFNATGMPAEYYHYPSAKVRHVGVMLAKEYGPVDAQQRAQYLRELEIPADAQVLFVTGGSQGSRIMNEAIRAIAPSLLDAEPRLFILHQVGKGHAGVYGDYHHERLRVEEFLSGMYRYSGAADIIVTRAGATNLAEFGAQGRACVVIPNPLLTGGHQVMNAEYLLQQKAVEVVGDQQLKDDPTPLAALLRELLKDSQKRKALGDRLQALTITDATVRVARLLLEAAEE